MQENFCKEHIRRRAEHLIRNCTRKKKVAYGGVIRLHTSQKNCSAFPFIKWHSDKVSYFAYHKKDECDAQVRKKYTENLVTFILDCFKSTYVGIFTEFFALNHFTLEAMFQM